MLSLYVVVKGTPEQRIQTRTGELTLVSITCDECHADRGIYYAKLHVEYDLLYSTAEQLTASSLKAFIETHKKK